MLHIGFDAKRAFLNHTGLGNYSRSVLTSLAHYFPENDYSLYTTKVAQNSQTAPLFEYRNIRIITPRFPFFRSAWRSRFVVPQLVKDRLNIYHGLSHEIPSGIRKTGIKTVVTMHDLIFLRYPQYYKAVDRKIYEAKFRYACHHADKIIAISEQTKNDLISFFGIDKNKIEVIYQSCAPQFRCIFSPQELLAIKETYHLPDRYLLYVGTIENRKNLMLLARALSGISANIKLIAIGKKTPYAREVEQYLEDKHLQERVQFLENIPYHILPSIYQLATVFIYPSEFEGFGIPILEALFSGVPVIAATGSCLEEAGGPNSIYVDPRDPEALADQINRVLGSPELRQHMINNGKEFAAAFTEQNHATHLMNLYQSLC